MARPLRIEYPGAFYHVTSRGNRKQPIFLIDDDRYFFLNCLRDMYERLGAVMHAYCLMDNHYHLLTETPQGQLSRMLHYINSRYAIYFNKKHGRCGHTFQARFKSILVEAQEYALEIVSYIHLNPVRAKIVDFPEEYMWSNYRQYVGLAEPQAWASAYRVLSYLGRDPEIAQEEYKKYVLERLDRGLPSPLEQAEPTGILGTSKFVDQIKQEFARKAPIRVNREVPQLRQLKMRPELVAILAATEKFFGPRSRYTKRMAIFIAHKKADYTLKELAAFFNMGISGISNNYRKIRRESDTNEILRRAADDIIRYLS